jgi:hypothetical protein
VSVSVSVSVSPTIPPCNELHPFCDNVCADTDQRCPAGGFFSQWLLGTDELYCCRPWGHGGDHYAFRPHVMFSDEPERALPLPYLVCETWHPTHPSSPHAFYVWGN